MVGHHVYMVVNSVTDIHLFEKDEDILPSVRISYHKVPNLTFKVERDCLDVIVHVLNADGTPYQTIPTRAKCVPVWNEPCHL
jgi:hypothetical protein